MASPLVEVLCVVLAETGGIRADDLLVLMTRLRDRLSADSTCPPELIAGLELDIKRDPLERPYSQTLENALSAMRITGLVIPPARTRKKRPQRAQPHPEGIVAREGLGLDPGSIQAIQKGAREIRDAMIGHPTD